MRAVVGFRALSLVPDGVVELEVARHLLAGDWSAALETRFHPLFGALCALLAAALTPLGGWVDLQSLAAGLTVLLSSLAAPCAALAAGELAPRPHRLRAAWAAGALVAVAPYPAQTGGQIMAYGAAHAALALAVWLTLRATRKPTPGAWALAGAAVGLGYLARSDALATGLGLGLALLWSQTQQLVAGRRLLLPLAWAAGLLLLMSPYLVAIRVQGGEWRLSLKKSVSYALQGGYPDKGLQPADTLDAEELARLESQAARGESATVLQDRMGYGWLESAGFVARILVRRATWPIVVLAGLGLLLAWAPATTDPSARHRLLAIPLATLSFAAVLTLFRASYGSIFAVHASAAGVLLAPLAGLGLVLGADRAGSNWALRVSALGSLTLLAIGVPLLVKAVQPQHPGRVHEKDVGALLRGLAGAGELTIAGRDSRVVAYYAQAKYLDVPRTPLDQLPAALQASGARFLVIHLRTKGERPGTLERRLATLELQRLEQPYETVLKSGDKTVRYEWLVYDLAP